MPDQAILTKEVTMAEMARVRLDHDHEGLAFAKQEAVAPVTWPARGTQGREGDVVPTSSDLLECACRPAADSSSRTFRTRQCVDSRSRALKSLAGGC